MRLNQPFLWVAALLLALVLPLSAQDSRGTVLGRVSDSTGAVVPNAEVRITNDATGVSAAAKTNDAGNFVRTIQARQGLQVGCPEEAAWRRGFLTDDDLRERAERYRKSGYGAYLRSLVD